MVLANAKRFVAKVWGGYSPKKDDGRWIKDHCEWFSEHVPDDVIIADNAFAWGAKHPDKFPRIHVNHKKNEKVVIDGDGEDESVLTKKQLSYNSSVRKVRARIESIFGESRVSGWH